MECSKIPTNGHLEELRAPANDYIACKLSIKVNTIAQPVNACAQSFFKLEKGHMIQLSTVYFTLFLLLLCAYRGEKTRLLM